MCFKQRGQRFGPVLTMSVIASMEDAIAKEVDDYRSAIAIRIYLRATTNREDDDDSRLKPFVNES